VGRRQTSTDRVRFRYGSVLYRKRGDKEDCIVHFVIPGSDRLDATKRALAISKIVLEKCAERLTRGWT